MISPFDSCLKKTPPRFQTPLFQSILLGVVFLLVFSAYSTVQFYASTTYGPELAANAVSSIYISFTIFCFVAPSVVNQWGTRYAMFVGILGYAVLLICSLVYFVVNTEKSIDEEPSSTDFDFLVILGGWVLGCGAALLWTGQGRLILEYARIAELQKNERNVAAEEEEENDGDVFMDINSGTINGVFWAVFQCSALLGGIITFVYYDRTPTGSVTLYIIFLVLVLLGAVATQFLLPPSMLQQNMQNMAVIENNHLVEDHNDSITHIHLLVKEESSLIQDKDSTINETILGTTGNSHHSWRREAKETLQIFTNKTVLLLSLTFFYTGFCRPYQQATFGNRFFNRRTIGLEMMIYNVSSIIGSIFCGRLLDSHKHNRDPFSLSYSSCYWNRKTPRSCALLSLFLFVIMTTLGDILAYFQEKNASETSSATSLDIGDRMIIGPTISFACWGFSDALIQVYCYWWMGITFTKGPDQARVVGFYKCIQSLGESIGFYFIPLNRMGAMWQLFLNFGVGIIGACLSCFDLPPCV